MSDVCWIIKGVLEGRVYGPTEVADLQHIKVVEDVLGFNITMDNVVAMQVSYTADNLPKIKWREVFFKMIFFANLLKKTTICYKF